MLQGKSFSHFKLSYIIFGIFSLFVAHGQCFVRSLKCKLDGSPELLVLNMYVFQM